MVKFAGWHFCRKAEGKSGHFRPVPARTKGLLGLVDSPWGFEFPDSKSVDAESATVKSDGT
jgi:hypothetical protein